MRQLPPLNTLRVFESAARNGSFVAAGEELYITASAVSHQIKSLEQFLGLDLFTRVKRKVSLTANGEKYFTSVRNALNELEVATQMLKHQAGNDVVVISVAPNFLLRWLMPRMHVFQEAHPEIELQISASTGLVDFNRSPVDMAVYFGDGNWSDVETHFLTHVQLVPVCSPRLATEARPLDTPNDLSHHTLIHVSKRLNEWPDWLELAGVHIDRPERSGLQLTSSHLATAAAQQGLGVALGDRVLSSSLLESGELIVPFDIQLEVGKSFYLVYQKGRVLTPAMQSFQQWIIEEMTNSLDVA